MKVAVVGHVEWIEFARVDHIPVSGEIVHATDWWEEPGGGGSVAAVQFARLAGGCTFLTALGPDENGRRAERELEAMGVRVEVATRDAATRRGAVLIDDAGERTITTLGERLDPRADDPLPWRELDQADAVYFTAGDVGALGAARRAKILVATTRVLDVLSLADLRLDAVVGSLHDPAERFERSALRHPPGLIVMTRGAQGGTWEAVSGERGAYDAAPLPGRIVDTYGSGDAFAAGLAFGLGMGLAPPEAIALAARCGAWCVTGRGPYGHLLTGDDL